MFNTADAGDSWNRQTTYKLHAGLRPVVEQAKAGRSRNQRMLDCSTTATGPSKAHQGANTVVLSSTGSTATPITEAWSRQQNGIKR